MIEDDVWEYPIGGPCGWMWRRAKEKTLAQDFNPNHLPTGSPDSTGGRFTTEENASLSVPPSAKVTEKQSSPKSDMPKKAESDRSYLKDAIYPAPDFSDFLPTPSAAGLKILKGLKLAYGFSEETLAFFAKFLAEEEGKKALAGAPKNVLKEEKTLSNLFEKKAKPLLQKSMSINMRIRAKPIRKHR
ncbi:hypothetical protein FAI41_03840 [Acetobacteraceae bacterium]|nr:hypothetical protein FAI41_03840 [Acetobacteraceae bacterium]